MEHERDFSGDRFTTDESRDNRHIPTLVQQTGRLRFTQPGKTKIRTALHLPLCINDTGAEVISFVGRDDTLDELMSSLKKDNEELGRDPRGTLAVALSGIGGIGKTTIAWAFAERCARENQFDFILWIPADEAGKIKRTMAAAAASLGLVSGKKSEDEERSTQVLLKWLEAPVKAIQPSVEETSTFASWLLIFDNVDDIDMVKKYIRSCQHGSVLITTRDFDPTFDTTDDVLSISGRDSQSPRRIEVKPLDQSQSIHFLRSMRRFAETDDLHQSLKKIVETLGGIPLVLRMVAATMRKRRITPGQFYLMYTDPASKSGFFHPPQSGHQTGADMQSVATVWGLDSLSTEARSLIRAIACMDADEIKESIFRDIRTIKDKSIFGQTFPSDLDRYQTACDELFRSSLVTRNIWQDSLRVHRIVQDVVRRQMLAPERRSTFNQIVCMLRHAWPEGNTETGGVWRNPSRDNWPICAQIKPHLIKLAAQYEEEYLRLEEEHAYDDISSEDFAQLLIRNGW